MQRFFGTSPPSIHQMVVRLTEKGLITRELGPR
jgi:Mn-dependent DtxR family transcriptional regulator